MQNKLLNVLRKLAINAVHAESRRECANGVCVNRRMRIEANLDDVALALDIPNSRARMSGT